MNRPTRLTPPTALLALGLLATTASAAPAVFWASDPVQPGETALLIGSGFGDSPTVAVSRFSDGSLSLWPAKPQRVQPLQANDGSVKFVVPASLKPGVFAYRISTPAGTVDGLLNRPVLWWAQGDLGLSATSGGSLRLFGRCLSLDPAEKTTVLLKGPKTLKLTAKADCYSAEIALPNDLPLGDYEVSAGGDAACSEPTKLTVSQPQPWPQTVFNVKDFGADGTGAKDDTAAIQSALAAAEKNSGGIVLLPRGRYRVTDMLTIPRFTVLRGEKPEWTCLFWPDMPKPPEALIKGTNSFSLEDLTLYASNHRHVIMGDLGNQPEAGNVTLRRVRVRADRYRGHLKPEDVDRLFRDNLRYHQGDTVRLGGANVVITDCDMYGSGRSLFLSRVRGGRVANNTLYNGRHGWYCISGSDGLIFENNRIIGADLMSTGGGLNCLDGSSYSRNIYYAHNTLSLMHGWDREAMTSDAGGGAYLGKAVSSSLTTLTLADDARWGNRDWRGAGVLVVDGNGRGQYRRVAKAAERTVELDQPLAVPLDDTSIVSITMLQEHYILAHNDFSDAGIAIQFYGISVEHIIAGNRSTRAGGFQNIGKLYSGRYDQPPEKNFGHQPSWFCQFLDNEILEGNIYRSGANNAILSGDSVVGVYGWPPAKTWPWPYNVATVVRGNKLLNNARIHVGGSQNELPSVRDVVVENNTIADSDEGVRIDRATASVFVRGNRLANVRQPLSGTGADKALVTPAQRAEAEQSLLRALAKDLGLADDPTGWPTVRESLERLRKLPDDSAEAPAVADGVLEAALTAIAQRKDTLPFQTLAPLLGLQVSVARESTLPTVLQSGKGGAATLTLALAAPGASPSWTLAAGVTPPTGWALGSPQVSAQPKSAQISIPFSVPAGAWGRHELPVTMGVGLPNAALRLPTSISVGSGFLRDWMLIGPFPNKSKAPLDISLHPPDDGIDLKAEYDDLAGKVRWQPVHTGDWLDLNTRLKTKQPGVAYAVACVEAERETPALLRLGSSGGVALSLNGAHVWSADKTRNAAPDQDRVPLTLRAGDNVLLFKLCTVSDQWRFTAELTPAAGGFAGKVQPVQPEQFASRKAFAPPPPRPKPTGAPDLKHTAGVDWRLAYSDDFEREGLSARWRAALGTWKNVGGVLTGSGQRAFLAYAEKLPAPIRIEYDCRAQADAIGDMSCFWLSDPTNYASGYLIGFGSNDNTANKVLIQGEQVATATRPLPAAGKWHHVIAQILADGRVQLIVDDQLSLNHRGPPPAEPHHPGLWAWGPAAAYDNVRIYAGAPAK